MYIFMGFGEVKWLPSSALVLILHNAIGFIAASLPNASISCPSSLISGLADEATGGDSHASALLFISK